MKLVRSICPLALVLSCLAFPARARAQDASAVVSDPYTQAVNSYLAAAAREVDALAKKLKAIETPQNRAELADAEASLQRCRDLLGQLGNADPKTFDPIKARYEKERAALERKINSATGS